MKGVIWSVFDMSRGLLRAPDSPAASAVKSPA